VGWFARFGRPKTGRTAVVKILEQVSLWVRLGLPYSSEIDEEEKEEVESMKKVLEEARFWVKLGAELPRLTVVSPFTVEELGYKRYMKEN
jgi:hypothetical protein